MRIVLTFFYLVVVSPIAIAQLTCSAPDIDPRQEKEIQKILQDLKGRASVVSSSGIIYIPIKVIGAARADGSTSFSMKKVNEGLAQTNAQFLQAGIQFFVCGDQTANPVMIQNDLFYEGDHPDNLSLLTPLLSREAHNLVYQGDLNGSGGYSYGTTQNYLYNRSHILIGQSADNKTVSHELGHWLNLAHTFNGSSISSERELVTRNFNETLPRISANCLFKGDYVCDTPADPFEISGGRLAECSGSALSITDLNGDVYAPDPTNIMGYYFCSGQNFTAGQFDRMQSAYLLNNTPSADPARAYTLNCAPTSQPAPSGVVASPLNEVVNKGVLLSWADNSGSETGYFIERSVNGMAWITIGATDRNVAEFLDNEIQNGSTAIYRVKPSNSIDLYAYSNSITTPVYCFSPTMECSLGRNTDDLIIRELNGTVVFSKVDQGCSEEGYGNYLSDTLKLKPDTEYRIEYRTGYNQGYYPQHVGLFADLNGDGDFLDEHEWLYHSEGDVMNGTTGISDTFRTPAGNFPRAFRLRLRSRLEAHGMVQDPCAPYAYSETDDYTLSLKSCSQSLVITSETEGFLSGETVWQAQVSGGEIISTSQITSESRSVYEAAAIYLNPGFQAGNGAVFTAVPGGCTN